MAKENQYQKLFRSKVASAIEQAKAAAGFEHQGVKGSVLEALITQLFEPLLPADIGVGTGQIIDSYSGIQSTQIDIILYDKSILPPILIDQRLGIFPIESVLYTIEVKTTLNATELKVAHDSAGKLAKDFGYLPGLVDESGKEKHHTIEKIRSVIFALNSDLTGTGLTEAERYRNIYKDDIAHLRAICIVGREYWFDDSNFWRGFKTENLYDETLAFIGGISNTYRSVADSRGQPKLGNYIVPPAKFFTSTKSRDVESVHVKCNGEGCELNGEFIPNMGTLDAVIKGRLKSDELCSSCGGTFESEEGEFIFKNGALQPAG
ncbi:MULTISPECIES: DUF6602 domain-containing protein [Aliivibrio]|uniref:DUF6602 domain-containing protein n=1 Tax=Aliivibrio TaxID=511678 RepID=UPI00080E7D9C|nr:MULTISPECIES: DUF6602 domain-containing protein [Aliivibrio]OCH17742.1 hypothetical protein A6E03_19645 [Aliivibrio sp. 1S128]OED54561.1 hypothetical protein BEI47_16985 [Aliivibrio fischeri]